MMKREVKSYLYFMCAAFFTIVIMLIGHHIGLDMGVLFLGLAVIYVSYMWYFLRRLDNKLKDTVRILEEGFRRLK